jgi:hypothetical protein
MGNTNNPGDSLLFSAADLPPNDPAVGWNGSFRGRPLDPGVFVFVAEVQFSDGTVRRLKGDVTLVR